MVHGLKLFKILFLLSALCIAGCGGAREGTNTNLKSILVEGVVHDVSGQPLTNATVLDLVSGVEAVISNGIFSIEAEPSKLENELQLLIQAEDKEDTITLQASAVENPDEQKFQLEIQANDTGFKATKTKVVAKGTKNQSGSKVSPDPLEPKLGDDNSKKNSKNSPNKGSNGKNKKGYSTPPIEPPVNGGPVATPTPVPTPPPVEMATIDITLDEIVYVPPADKPVISIDTEDAAYQPPLNRSNNDGTEQVRETTIGGRYTLEILGRKFPNTYYFDQKGRLTIQIPAAALDQVVETGQVGIRCRIFFNEKKLITTSIRFDLGEILETTLNVAVSRTGDDAKVEHIERTRGKSAPNEDSSEFDVTQDKVNKINSEIIETALLSSAL